MKKFISGLIIGIIITTMVTAFAAISVKEAYFNTQIKVNYNGKPIDIEKVTVIKDGEVNGRTYGSINDIAIALGKSVSWDNATKTINITDTEVKSMSTVTETTQTATIDTSEWISISEYAKNNPINYEKYVRKAMIPSYKQGSVNILKTEKGDVRIFNDSRFNYLNIQDLEDYDLFD